MQSAPTTGQVAPTHDRASCPDGKSNLSQAIPDIITKINYKDYKQKTLSGENSNAHPCAINEAQERNQSQASERAIPENTSEITNQRIHTNTLSSERAARAFPPSPEKFTNILKMRISLFELVLYFSLNFIINYS